MAKASFQRNQRVWVESVGAWSVVERIVPVWAKGFSEPVRLTYDVGFGRDFLAHELRAEDDSETTTNQASANWRLLRAKNKWQALEDCTHHPYPGSYPVVVTDTNDWGGWRTPGAEYDRDPRKIEAQARLIVSAPRLLALAQDLLSAVADAADDAPPAMVDLARRAQAIDRFLREVPGAEPTPQRGEPAAERQDSMHEHGAPVSGDIPLVRPGSEVAQRRVCP